MAELTEEELEVLVQEVEKELDRQGIAKSEDVSAYAEIVKSDLEQRKVWAVVLEPYSVDGQRDWADPVEIEKTAHSWLANHRESGLRHRGEPNTAIQPIESYVAPASFRLGDQVIRKGSWVLAVYVGDDEAWDAVQKGDLNGFSIQGKGKRLPRNMPVSMEGEEVNG